MEVLDNLSDVNNLLLTARAPNRKDSAKQSMKKRFIRFDFISHRVYSDKLSWYGAKLAFFPSLFEIIA